MVQIVLSSLLEDCNEKFCRRFAVNKKKSDGATHPESPNTYGGFVFVEHLVVTAQSDAEDDGRHILKAVDPLFPL